MDFNRVQVFLDKPDDVFTVRPVGDVHAGNLGFDKEKFERTLKTIAKTRDLYTIGMGDYIDNVMAWANGSVDKRWNPETVERDRMTTEEQIDYFVKQWEQVASKCFGMLSGNHEWKTINQRRFIKDFCNPVDPDNFGKVLYNQKYLGRMGIIHLRVKHKKKTLKDYQILCHHGGFAGMRQGGTINRLEDITAGFENIDVSLMGHTHRTWTASSEIMGYSYYHNSFYQRKMIMGNTGTFLKSYSKGVDSYIEASPRRPTRTGTISVTFDPYNEDIFGHD